MTPRRVLVPTYTRETAHTAHTAHKSRSEMPGCHEKPRTHRAQRAGEPRTAGFPPPPCARNSCAVCADGSASSRRSALMAPHLTCPFTIACAVCAVCAVLCQYLHPTKQCACAQRRTRS